MKEDAIKSALEKVKAQKENFGFMDRFDVDENYVVAEALEKQIPMKPNTAINYSWGTRKEVKVCPKCDYYLSKIHFIETGDGKSIKTSYCEICGQKIDWSDEE